MKFVETDLAGAYVIELQIDRDERGFFARSWSRQEFEEHGLNHEIVQCNISYNIRRGTIRGMHYQAWPHEEAKLVRCTRGAIYDVVVDLRPTSPTWQNWIAIELTASNRKTLYIPEGCAHGYQTLRNHSEILYQMCAYYQPEAARGFLWNDPAIAIPWPLPDPIVSTRDRSLPLADVSLRPASGRRSKTSIL